MPSKSIITLSKISIWQPGKKHSQQERPCVDYWAVLSLLPTWASQWFVSGMAELLSGRSAYVTGAADNTWVLSWGQENGLDHGGRRRGHRSPLRQPLVGWGGHFVAWIGTASLLCCSLQYLRRTHFLWFYTRAVESEQKTSKQTIHLLWWNYKLQGSQNR